MTLELNGLLTEIGETLLAAANDEWLSIRQNVTFYSDGYKVESGFLDRSEVWQSFTASRTVHKAFDRMREIYRAIGRPVWGQVCYTVTLLTEMANLMFNSGTKTSTLREIR